MDDGVCHPLRGAIGGSERNGPMLGSQKAKSSQLELLTCQIPCLLHLGVQLRRSPLASQQHRVPGIQWKMRPLCFRTANADFYTPARSQILRIQRLRGLSLVVLDGHDGLESVQWLSEHMFEIFSEVLDDSMFSGSCLLEEADRDTGLCCPVEFSPTLTESFQAADRQLLEKLKSEKS